MVLIHALINQINASTSWKEWMFVFSILLCYDLLIGKPAPFQMAWRNNSAYSSILTELVPASNISVSQTMAQRYLQRKYHFCQIRQEHLSQRDEAKRQFLFRPSWIFLATISLRHISLHGKTPHSHLPVLLFLVLFLTILRHIAFLSWTIHFALILRQAE